MADLVIDLGELRQRVTSVRMVAQRLSAVGSDASGIAGVVGHDRLASKVRDFGSKWSVRRQKLVEQLNAIANVLEAIAQTYEDLDRDLARGASGGGK